MFQSLDELILLYRIEVTGSGDTEELNRIKGDYFKGTQGPNGHNKSPLK